MSTKFLESLRAAAEPADEKDTVTANLFSVSAPLLGPGGGETESKQGTGGVVSFGGIVEEDSMDKFRDDEVSVVGQGFGVYFDVFRN